MGVAASSMVHNRKYDAEISLPNGRLGGGQNRWGKTSLGMVGTRISPQFTAIRVLRMMRILRMQRIQRFAAYSAHSAYFAYSYFQGKRIFCGCSGRCAITGKTHALGILRMAQNCGKTRILGMPKNVEIDPP